MKSATQRKPKKRTSFTPEEDDRLRELVGKYGFSDWNRIAHKLPKRDTRQCRERWFNYLSPDVQNGPWTLDEEALLAEKVCQHGRTWKLMTAFFQGRTDINLKNHWNYMEKRRLSARNPETEEVDPVDQILTVLAADGNAPLTFAPVQGPFPF